MNSPTVLSHGAMLLFSALVAGSFSLGHMIANEITPAALTALRFVIAAMILGVLVWRTCGVSRDDLAALWRYLLLGGLMGAYFILMFEGLKTASAVSGSAGFSFSPMVKAVCWLHPVISVGDIPDCGGARYWRGWCPMGHFSR
ncbi:MAG TPA: EamA family transporter [Arenicellales bacterium]|nr:EamA family transporter [Arenicellales bacterium]